METYDLRRRMAVLAILYGCPDHRIQDVVDRAMSRRHLTLANAGDYIAQSMTELNVRDVHLVREPRRRNRRHV